MKEKKALLFLKKKKQKNFCSSVPLAASRHGPRRRTIHAFGANARLPLLNRRTPTKSHNGPQGVSP